MSLLARAEMAESKLRWIEEQCDTALAMGMYLDPRHLIGTIKAEVWDGYQIVDDDVDYAASGGRLNDKKHSPKCGERPHAHGWECDPTCPGCDAGRTTPLRDAHPSTSGAKWFPPRDHKEP